MSERTPSTALKYSDLPLIAAPSEAPALIDAKTSRLVTYAELHELVQRRSAELAHLSGGLAFHPMDRCIESIVDYLAYIETGTTVLLLDPATKPEVLKAWIEQYRPEHVGSFKALEDTPAPAAAQEAAPAAPTSPAPAAEPAAQGNKPVIDAVLLPSSGSTGNPKFIRLSKGNLTSNAAQIAQVLQIDSQQRAITHLPLFYSFGLSILNSHLMMGASILLSQRAPIQPEFWDQLNEHQVTSLSGVPYSFSMFRRTGLLEKDVPSLQHVTQAGGRLAPELVELFHGALKEKGIKFWVMYGQTEATARISILAADELEGRIGSVGKPLPGGEIEILDPSDSGDGEIIYRGPNIMNGYAFSREDINTENELDFRLSTGDIGRIDKDGFLWITGRLARFVKISGKRYNLDDLEGRFDLVEPPFAFVQHGERLAIVIEGNREDLPKARECERQLGLDPRSVLVEQIAQLPKKAQGKIDYQKLETLLESS